MLLFVLVILFADPKTGELNTGVGYFQDAKACQVAKAAELKRLTDAGVPAVGSTCTEVTLAKVS